METASDSMVLNRHITVEPSGISILPVLDKASLSRFRYGGYITWMLKFLMLGLCTTVTLYGWELNPAASNEKSSSCCILGKVCWYDAPLLFNLIFRPLFTRYT